MVQVRSQSDGVPLGAWRAAWAEPSDDRAAPHDADEAGARIPDYKGGHPVVVGLRIGKCAGQGRAEAVLQAMPYFQREVSPAGWMQWAVLQAMRSSQRDAATSQVL